MDIWFWEESSFPSCLNNTVGIKKSLWIYITNSFLPLYLFCLSILTTTVLFTAVHLGERGAWSRNPELINKISNHFPWHFFSSQFPKTIDTPLLCIIPTAQMMHQKVTKEVSKVARCSTHVLFTVICLCTTWGSMIVNFLSANNFHFTIL